MVRFACDNDKQSATGSIDRLLNYYPSITLHAATGTVFTAAKWHSVEVRLAGNRITVLLDDKIIVDYVEEGEFYPEGRIGAYLLRGKAKIRKFEIKRH
jgi:hypothetical protein